MVSSTEAAFGIGIVAVGVGLYAQRVPQKIWDAVSGGTPGTGLSAVFSGAQGSHATGNAPNVTTVVPGAPSNGNVDNSTYVAQLTVAEQKSTVAALLAHGNDLWDWCLDWVRRTRENMGLPTTGVYDAATAANACSRLSLHPGIAPVGATVCFTPNHIGIANANGTYTSAGLIHGGTTVQTYLGNPNYLGWAP